MEILAGIASKLGELLVDATVKQARYLFCFNSIVKELEDKEAKLKEAQDGINEKVEEERQKHCAVVVEKDVEKWLADVVKDVEDEAEHESAHLGVPAGMNLNTSHAAHLGIMIKSARDVNNYPSWQNCYAELPKPLIS